MPIFCLKGFQSFLIASGSIWSVDLDSTEGPGDHETLCQLVKGPSMLKHSWASSLKVPIKLCFFGRWK